jgi:type II secretory ATPase GspE/PulE/Tfp pilus assembly ATPase PilB-like protein
VDAVVDPLEDAFALMIQVALQRDASSFSLETSLSDEEGNRAGWLRYRVDGAWEPACRFDARLAPALVERWKRGASCDVREVSLPQDGRILVTTGATPKEQRMVDLRVSFLPCMFGESMTVKLLDQRRSRWRLDQLELAEREHDFLRVALRSRGKLIVVAGLAGSARSTLLAAALREIAGQRHKLVTVEGQSWPVLPWATQISVRMGQSRSFAIAVGTALRSDPDIIGLETLADAETLAAVQDACRHGALVVAGVAADNSVAALRNLFELAGGSALPELELILGQRLLRKLCPGCAVPEKVSAEERRPLDSLAAAGGLTGALKRAAFGAPGGCSACAGTGYRKRVMVAEGLRVTPALRRLLRDGASDGALLAAAVEDGMTSLDAQSIALAASGQTSREELSRFVPVAMDAI